MKALYDDVSLRCSKLVTRSYSTSFSLGIRLLSRELRDPVYAVYGFVRFADEIVDTFHEYDKCDLLQCFRQDTRRALNEKISLNPILHSFQEVVHRYNIEHGLIDAFLHSMEMDLAGRKYDQKRFEEYVFGSAEVVGLMCLRVFVDGDEAEYQRLKAPAMKLGAAFQKVNFLRDLKADYEHRGRSYFPKVDPKRFDHTSKQEIEADIDADFAEAVKGIPTAIPQGPVRGLPGLYVLHPPLRKDPQYRTHGDPAETRAHTEYQEVRAYVRKLSQIPNEFAVMAIKEVMLVGDQDRVGYVNEWQEQ